MKKEQQTLYRFYRYEGKMISAKKAIPFEMSLQATLLLDHLCYTWNKQRLEQRLNAALDQGDKETFLTLSEEYRHYME